LRQITGEELYQMGDIGSVELINGEIVEVAPTKFRHGHMEAQLGASLSYFVAEHKLGSVAVGEVGLYTRRNPDTVRGVDVIFISHQRLAQASPESYLDIAPELAVEIVSPSDRWSEVMDKLEEYFSIGVLMVWIVDPRKRQIHVYSSPTEVIRLQVGDTLDGGDILPGFTLPVADLFPTTSQ
jgi:Uma2 family endonuclease